MFNFPVRFCVGVFYILVGIPMAPQVGTEWPKWLRFGLVIAGAGGLAYILAKFADLIWNIILSLVLLVVLWGIGSWLWKAI